MGYIEYKKNENKEHKIVFIYSACISKKNLKKNFTQNIFHAIYF